MFYYLGVENIFVRAALVFFCSSFLAIFFGKNFIALVKNYLQPIREDGPSSHIVKKNTPTFGGILIFITFLISYFLFVKFNYLTNTILISGFLFLLIGFLDDFLKLKFKNSKGVKGQLRLLFGFIIGFYIIYRITSLYPADIAESIYFPFFYTIYIPVGLFIYIWGSFVMVGTVNSVNLTDGLDGLASLTSLTVLTAFFILAVLIVFPSNYENFIGINPVLKSSIAEVLIVIAALIGALIGFLWHNSYPAKIFMGDTGSLFIGGSIGAIALAIKHELILAIAGLVFVIEAVSVIIQVYYYKSTKKRFFLMAPIHHHFEKKGLKETEVVMKFWIFTIFTAVLALLIIRYN